MLGWLGIVWELHFPPQPVIKREHRLGRFVIDKVGGQLAASFPINQIAHEMHEALVSAPGWADVKARTASARGQAEAFWNEIDLPQVPSLEDVRLCPEAIGGDELLEDIVVRAREWLLELIYARLKEAASSPQSATTG
jgi:hypothetical protein